MFESFLGVNPWTALFILLNTLTIFFVAKKFLFGPVMKLIEDRQKEIDGIYESADTANAQAQALRQEYTQRLSQAKAESETIVREAVARGQNREEEILRKARDEAQALRAKAAGDIALEKQKALQDAKAQIGELAVAIAGKVVEKELTSQDQSQLIDRFLDDLGDGL